ncbi:Metallophosphoesterase MPPED2 [Cercospora beticola]|uniref:Metallophosphoesterase MPPED2 n=1 Tax=Cercospora beticola TaxID=122368 RepID=A0A2G5HYS6_CERBT|nr:Metallophosphoesterase MPPED2 [Cercospora beticola]PIA97651.1 Metallophosphoesterase MPPED2 [Cercospora beticola]WPA99286.1 hypothetical protein RHO25_003903 [Cercospora beticola]
MIKSKPPRNPYAVPSLYLQLLSPLKLLARLIDLLISLLRPHNPTRKNITLVCISDTHTLIPSSLPYGDILIHSGDLTNAGTPRELQAQISWLSSLPHKHKIIISGNHDSHLDPRSRGTLSLADRNTDIDWKNLIYLQDSHITLPFPTRGPSIAGKYQTTKLKIYGSPFVPHVGGPEHAFQHPRSQDYWTGKIPEDTDILITHCPPRFHLDLPGVQAMGDEFLLHEVRRVKPAVHVFGHIHAGRSDLFGKVRGGKEVVRWDRAERHLAEVLKRESPESLTDWALNLGNLVLWYHFLAFVYWSVREVLGEVFCWRDEPPSTIMVNAAMMYEDEGRLGNSPQVIHL